MKHFQTPSHPSRRRDPNPRARDLAVGHDNAKAIHRGTVTLHLRPVRATDHHRRYAPDRPLNVRAFVGGPTWCKIIIITTERAPLTSALTLANAKQAGYRTTAELQEAHERSYGTGRSDRQVWIIRFRLDATELPRLLAATGDVPSSYKLGADGRWRYVESHDEREGDRGYTSIASRALNDEMPALTDDDYRKHIAGDAKTRELERTIQQQAERETTAIPARVAQARARARANGYEMRDEFRLLDRLIAQQRTTDIDAQLRMIESRVFPRAA